MKKGGVNQRKFVGIIMIIKDLPKRNPENTIKKINEIL